MPILRSIPHQLADIFDALLQRPIAFHRIFVDVAGGALPGLFLSQAWYWSHRTQDADGWFYKTQAEWAAETGLTRSEQETARKYLRTLGILEEERRGLPAKLYYRLSWETLQTRMLETCKLVSGKPADLTAENPQTISETTAETTAEKNPESPTEILSTTAADGFVQDGPYTPWDATLEIPSPKKKRAITPLPPDDWIAAQLLIYRNDFDREALNDDEWWANTANSFPVFDPDWVKAAFASLARWLQDNPKRRPRTARGWKQRMSYSLNWYYDKHTRRESYGSAKTRPHW